MAATLVELAVEALQVALRAHTGRWLAFAVLTTGIDLQTGGRRAARRRAAIRRGVTLEDAPRPALSGCTPVLLPLALRGWPWLRRGQSPPMPSCPFWLAVAIVRELEERRSWRAALQATRTSTARPVSSDRTAASEAAAAA